jgi:DNA replication factor GINS
MNLDELQSVKSRERQTDQLQQLRPTFYEEAGEFVNQLREERERAAERADDPFDAPEVNRLTNDIKTAEQTVEAIYERRVGKVVKKASLAAADMPTEDGGLTQEEQELFETLVTAIEQNRGHVLDVIAGEAPAGGDAQSTPAVTDDDSGAEATRPSSDPSDVTATESTPDPSTADTEPTVDAADLMGGETQSGSDEGSDRPHSEAAAIADEDAPPQAPSGETDGGPRASERTPEPDGGETTVDRQTVRITADVGEIFGVDEREYDLSTDDVVTLPADNADPLVEQDAAEPLD